MKHILISLFLILSTSIFAANHTFKYTFTNETFAGSILYNVRETLQLHNRQFIITNQFPSSTLNVKFIPGRGLRIYAGSGTPTFAIYTKTSDPTLSASITLEAVSSSNKISFSKPKEPSTPVPEDITIGIHTYSYNYTNNTTGPKIIISLHDTIYIKSIECTFSTPDTPVMLSLVNDNETIASFTTDSFSTSIPLPTITNFNTDYHHIGWTTTPVTDPQASLQPITNLSSIPTSATTLYALYDHYFSSARPTSATTTFSDTQHQSAGITIPLTTPAFLAYAHIHCHNLQGYNITHSLNFDNGFYLSPDPETTSNAHFFSPDFNGLLPLTSPLTITCSTNIPVITQLTEIDSVIIGTIPASAVSATYHTSIPSTPCHIHLTEPASLTSTLSALDDISYSMTIDDSRYFFFSLPFDVPYSGISFTPLSGPFPSAYYSDYVDNHYIGDWVISDYDEANNEWRDIELQELQSTGLRANHGYTIGLAKTNTTATVTFTSAHSDSPITITPDQVNTSLPTQYTSSNDPEHHGWNLLGNPYYSPLSSSSINAPYVLIPNNTSDDKKNPYTLVYMYAEGNDQNYTTEADIPPFSPFFVQTPLSSMAIAPQPSSEILPDTHQQTYHFNIVCTSPDMPTSVLTILSNTSFSEDYEIGLDLLSLTPDISLTHDNLAIYASYISVGDTISLTLPSHDASLSLGNNIMIPDNWDIRFLPDKKSITIIDNTITSVEDVAQSINHDTEVTIYTIDGRLVHTGLYGESSLSPGIYILRTSSGKTHKIAIN